MAQIFCSNCGQSINAGSNFCAACGFRVGQQHPPAAAPAPHPPGQPPHQQLGQAATQAGTTPSFEYPNHKPHSRIVKHVNTPEEQTTPTVEFQDLHPNSRWLFFMSYMGTTSIVLLLFVGGLLVQPVYFGLALAAYLATLFGAAAIAYKNYKFEVTPHAFRKEYGVIHKQSASIPFDQIQNVNIKRGFMDRLLGLCHLEIETAGTGGETKRNIIGGVSTGAEGIIPGIAYDEARDLKDLMLARANAHPAPPPYPPPPPPA